MFFCCLLEGQEGQEEQKEQQRDFKGPKVFKAPKKDVGLYLSPWPFQGADKAVERVATGTGDEQEDVDARIDDF